MTRSSWLTGALFAGLFLAFHLLFLPPALDDVDAINFALGIRDYDVSRHQPHPPGYPLFMVAAKGLHGVGLSEVHALSLVNVLGGAVAVFGCFALFSALDEQYVVSGVSRTNSLTWLAVLLVITCPLYWVTAARPLSDAAGLAAALAAQALIVTAPSVSRLAVAAAVAGLAAGVRSQVVWLTLPLLGLAVARLPPGEKWRGFVRSTIAYVVGVLVWAIPLVIVSGPAKYFQTFLHQGAEDIGGVALLATTHTVSLLVLTLREQLISPWGHWQVAAAVLLFAGLGIAAMLARSRPALLTLIAAFAPYLVFDFLFEEAVTTRYALPLIVPAAYLVVRGAAALHRNVAIAAALAVILVSVMVDDAAIHAYSGMPAPAFRMLGDMQAAASQTDNRPPVLAMHRNQDFSTRRPIQWQGNAMPAVAGHLPAPPKHEWLEVVNYWNGGGRAPVWFVADPLRSDLALIRHQRRPVLYRWPLEFKSLVGGARPDELDWHVMEAPDWYLGEGWALTPETAGVAAAERRGPGFSPIRGWIHRSPQPVTLMIGGRNLSPGGPPARVRIAVDGAIIADLAVAPGFFLHSTHVAAADGPGDYAELTVESDSQQVAIEQFDAQPPDRVVSGFGDGWNELEYNPKTGVLWRWSTDKGVIHVRSEGHALALVMRGEIEAASSSHVVVRAGGSVVAEFDVGRSFSRTVVIPAAALRQPEDGISIETSAWYVPAERKWRSADRRRLGLKLYECTVTRAF